MNKTERGPEEGHRVTGFGRGSECRNEPGFVQAPAAEEERAVRQAEGLDHILEHESERRVPGLDRWRCEHEERHPLPVRNHEALERGPERFPVQFRLHHVMGATTLRSACRAAGPEDPGRRSRCKDQRLERSGGHGRNVLDPLHRVRVDAARPAQGLVGGIVPPLPAEQVQGEILEALRDRIVHEGNQALPDHAPAGRVRGHSGHGFASGPPR